METLSEHLKSRPMVRKARRPQAASRMRRFAPLLACAGLIMRGSRQVSAVALTFDDGPHPQYTGRILDILAEYQAQATFFAVGKEAQRSPELVRRIVAEGHTLGCHTQRHANLAELNPLRAWRECVEGRATLESLASQPIRYLRPPWGRLGLTTLPIVFASGMRPVLWSLDSLDYRGESAEWLLRRLAEQQPGPGEILLLHEDGANTVEALPAMLRYLRGRGLECLSLDALRRRAGGAS